MAAASGKGGAKWIPALPHGWEAKYDVDNKAYFFIDHVNKKTQWDDPRFPKPAQRAHPPTQAASAVAASSLGTGGGPVETHGAIALQDLKPPLHPKNQRPKSRSSVNNIVHEASFTNEVDTAIVNKLKAEFPKAAKDLITNMLALCHNSERETREQLNDLGFLTNYSNRKNSNHASPQKNTNAGAPTPKKSTETHPLSPVEPTSPVANKEMSDADKKRVMLQVKGLFPKLDPEVVRLATIKCFYNLEEVKIVLTAWEKRYENNEVSRGTAARNGVSSANSSLSSVRSFSPTAGSLEPVGLDDGGTPHKLNTHPSGHSISPKPSTGASSQSFIQGAKGDAVPSSKISCPQHARAKQVTKMSEHLLNTTSDLLNHLATTASCCTNGDDEEEEGKKKMEAEGDAVATDDDTRNKQPAATLQPAVIISQPTVEQKSKTSQYRTESKGPDASLRRGPDSTLLTSDYTQANGPDKSIRAGPDSSRLTGSQGAVGPDVSLRCGSQRDLLQENRNNSTTTTSNMLVSQG